MLTCLALTLALAPSLKPDVVHAKLVGPYFQVTATVNEKPLTFLVDTGAGLTVLTPEGAKKAGVQGGATVNARGANGGSVPAKLVKLNSIKVGRSTVRDEQAVVLELPPILRCDGLVGYSFLKHFVTSFDYSAPSLTLVGPKDFHPHREDHEADLTLKSNHPHVSGTVASKSGLLMFDTGADGSLTLHSPFVEENQLRSKLNAGKARIVGKGVGGFLMGNLAEVPSLSLAGFDLSNVPTVLSARLAGGPSQADVIGRIGADVIRRFILTLDYTAGKAYFRKSKLFTEPYTKDRSGLYLDYDGKRFMVVGVVPGSPADAAGLKLKDEVLSINSVQLASLHPLEARKPFKGSTGSKVAVGILRADQRLEIALTLRDF